MAQLSKSEYSVSSAALVTLLHDEIIPLIFTRCNSQYGSRTSEAGKFFIPLTSPSPITDQQTTYTMARRRKARLVASLAARAVPRAPTAVRQSVKRRPARKSRGRRRVTQVTARPSPPCAEFPLICLPPELILIIASFLRPRTVLAMLLTSPAFGHLSSIFAKLSRQEHQVTEHGCTHLYTPLQFFCSRGIESVVRRLLNEGADPNDVCYSKPKNQLSPLTHAIGFHSASIVSLLIQHGAEVNERIVLGYGFSPLQIAVGQPHQIHPQLLPDRPAYTLRRGQLVQIVQSLLDSGADVTTVHRKRGTPLHMACAAREANPGIAAALIAAGADVHCKFEEAGSVAYRVEHGLDGGIQPIHYAAAAGNGAIVQLLLDAGVHIEVATRNGIRPLDNAVLSMRADVVALLREAGADTDTTRPRSKSASGRSTEVERLRSDTAEFLGVRDPWMLARNELSWVDLDNWLLFRGCRVSRVAMGAWGINYRRRRSESFPFV